MLMSYEACFHPAALQRPQSWGVASSGFCWISDVLQVCLLEPGDYKELMPLFFSSV